MTQARANRYISGAELASDESRHDGTSPAIILLYSNQLYHWVFAGSDKLGLSIPACGMVATRRSVSRDRLASSRLSLNI